MKKRYTVILEQTLIAQMDVDALTEKAAEIKAREWVSSCDWDSSGDITCVSVVAHEESHEEIE